MMDTQILMLIILQFVGLVLSIFEERISKRTYYCQWLMATTLLMMMLWR